MSAHRPLIVGNWKLNPATVDEARTLFLEIGRGLGRKPRQLDIAVAPPAPFLSELKRLGPSKQIALVAQDVFFESTGAHTGEISLPMVRSVGATAIIVGHSERRARGETEAEICQKLQAIMKAGVTAIVCVGEQERDSQGQYYSVVEAQLRSTLGAVAVNKLRQLVIAYEPVWAIGTGKQATPEDVQEMKLFIQKIIADCFGRAAIARVRILYGGSVKPENTTDLLTVGLVDGFLVGGASLKSKDFLAIITNTETYGKKKPTLSPRHS